jgi:hypothetical protein
VSKAGAVTVSLEDIKGIHYGYHRVDHSVHELTYNLAIWVLRALEFLLGLDWAVHLG